jgi:hypothetical protein
MRHRNHYKADVRGSVIYIRHRNGVWCVRKPGWRRECERQSEAAALLLARQLIRAERGHGVIRLLNDVGKIVREEAEPPRGPLG